MHSVWGRGILRVVYDALVSGLDGLHVLGDVRACKWSDLHVTCDARTEILVDTL